MKLMKFADYIYKRKDDFFIDLSQRFIEFSDGLVMHNIWFDSSAYLIFSEVVPMNKYIQYCIQGAGTELYFFLTGSKRSRVLVELVNNNRIVTQRQVILEKDGPQGIKIPSIIGRTDVRFLAMDENCKVRLLLGVNRRFLFLCRRFLAGYLLEKQAQ